MGSISIDREGFLANIFLARKGPCRVATTASITLSGEQTIDGVSVVADDRVLVKDQTDSLNAIYVCKTGAWELAQDFDQRGHVTQGTQVFVISGTTNAQTEWYVTTTGRPVPGREAIAFSQLSASEISGLTPTNGYAIIGNGTTWTSAGFLQAGTGASTRTWQTKVRDIVDARDFGLTADGSTDDTSALQAAITYVGGTLNGGVVELPAGTIKITSGITNPYSNVLVRGRGSNRNHNSGSGVTAATLVEWHGSAGGTMYRQYTPTGLSNAIRVGGGVVGMDFEGRELAAIGVELDSVVGGLLDTIFVTGVTTAGFDFDCGVEGVDHPEACSIQFWLFKNLSWRLIDAVAEQSADGMLLAGSSNANVSYNTFINCGGVTYDGDGIDGIDADGNSFICCSNFNVNSGFSIRGRGAVAGVGSFYNNHLFGCGGHIKFEGTDAGYSAASTLNFIDKLDTANGATVTLGTGASYWGDQGYYSASRIGINTTSPSYRIDISSGDTSVERVRMANTGTGGSGIAAFEQINARNDSNATFFGRYAAGYRRTDGTAIASGAVLGGLLFGGQWGTDTSFQSAKLLYPASIKGVAEGNFTASSAMRTGLAFFTGATGEDIVTANSAYGTERMRIDGVGNVIAPNNAATLSTAATDGLLHIPTSTSGSTSAPIGTPTTYTGAAPMVYDTGSNRLWVYNGAWRSVALSS